MHTAVIKTMPMSRVLISQMKKCRDRRKVTRKERKKIMRQDGGGAWDEIQGGWEEY